MNFKLSDALSCLLCAVGFAITGCYILSLAYIAMMPIVLNNLNLFNE